MSITYACGHHTMIVGCGGCDPGAIEYILEDRPLGTPPLLRKTRPYETTTHTGRMT